MNTLTRRKVSMSQDKISHLERDLRVLTEAEVNSVTGGAVAKSFSYFHLWSRADV